MGPVEVSELVCFTPSSPPPPEQDANASSTTIRTDKIGILRFILPPFYEMIAGHYHYTRFSNGLQCKKADTFCTFGDGP